MIEAYFHQETPVAIVAKQLVDAKQFTMSITFSNVVEQHLNTEQYKENKRRCGRTEIIFAEEKEYIAKIN